MGVTTSVGRVGVDRIQTGAEKELGRIYRILQD
jgi:hypothetical protein